MTASQCAGSLLAKPSLPVIIISIVWCNLSYLESLLKLLSRGSRLGLSQANCLKLNLLDSGQCPMGHWGRNRNVMEVVIFH